MQGTGDPILFLHGSPGGSDQGALLGAFLAERGFCVVAPSRAGYLSTPLTGRTSTPDGQAQLHAALMDALGFDCFGLMCWSGGGPSGYRLAATHPQRVTAMVMLAAVSKRYVFAEANDPIYRLFVSNAGVVLMNAMVRLAPRMVIGMSTSEGSTLSKQQAKELAEQIWSDPRKRKLVLALSKTIAGRTTGLRNDEQQFPQITDLQLAQIKCTTLLVHGTADTDVPPEHSDYAATQVAGSELIRVANGTHVCTWASAQAQELQDRIAAFFWQTKRAP